MFVAEDNEVRGHDHVTGKYRSSAYWSCNTNLKLTSKVPAIFHVLKDYGSHLIMQEIRKFDVKLKAIPYGLEKHMAFAINKTFVFIDNMQFMNSTLDALVKNLSDNDFR